LRHSLEYFHTWCIGWSTASAVQLGFGNETALATEGTRILQRWKRVPSVAKASGLRQLYGAPKGAPLQSQKASQFLAAVAPSSGYQQSDTVPEGRLYADLGSFRVSLAQPLHAGPGFRTMKAA